MSKKRIASISCATRGEDGYEYDNNGALIADDGYPGSASIILEVDHPTRKTEEGYPVRGKLVVGKFLFPPAEGETEAEEAFVDYTESFLNVTFWHAVERSPKAKG